MTEYIPITILSLILDVQAATGKKCTDAKKSGGRWYFFCNGWQTYNELMV